MEILSFDVCGKLAHFRKYYANNTAFTYSMPPRTTVIGMLAAVMGYDRDQYYEQLSSQNLRVGIRVLNPIKKTFHRLNFLSIKSLGDAIKGTGDFTGAGGHIQTPVELVSGLHPGCDWVAYRIFLAAGQDGNEEFLRIKEAFSQRRQYFNLALGTANFSAWLAHIAPPIEVEAVKASGFIHIHSAIPSEKISQLHLDKETEGYGNDNYLEEELMPADFVGNGNRELSKLIRVIFSTQGMPFLEQLHGDNVFYQVPDLEGNLQNVFFLE